MEQIKNKKNIKDSLNQLINQERHEERVYQFRSVTITCRVPHSLNKEQYDYLESNFIEYVGKPAKRYFKISILVDNNLVTKITEIMNNQQEISKYRVFREHTNTEFHHEYLIDGLTVFFASHWPNTFLVKMDENHFCILLLEDEAFDKRYAIYVIREIIRKTADLEKLVLFHGASVVIDNKGILLIGDKGAGKTTMLCHLMANHLNASVIANDRTFLEKTNGDFTLHYFPLKYRLGVETARLYPRVKDAIYEKYVIKNPQKANLLIEGKSNSKFSMLEKEFEEALNCNAVSLAPLKAILYLQIKIGSDELTIEELSDKDIEAVLKKNNLSKKDDLFIDDWIIKRHEYFDTDAYYQQFIGDMIRCIPIIKVCYGSEVSGSSVVEFLMKNVNI